jgi:hypothetical protein
MSDFLIVQGRDIVHQKKKVRLRGVNLGGWLMMEGYILHSLNRPVRVLKESLTKSWGPRGCHEWEVAFRENFITEEDFRRISDLGWNCVRVPFHYGLIETKPYCYDAQGVAVLDRVIAWAKRFRVWVILDLHAACGSQNHDWHSDSRGKAALWTSPSCQRRTRALWTFLAARYRAEPAVAGYDLLNEAVVADSSCVTAFYQKLIQDIRAVDPHHMIFAEGNSWSTDLSCLDALNDPNLVYSVHAYEPLDFTFNFVPSLRYPLRNAGGKGSFTKASMRRILSRHRDFAESRQRPLLVGEFGVNYRDGLYGEARWLEDMLDVFYDFDFHWTYWTYKAVKNAVFPDGVFSYYGNPPWVRREGPLLGWDNYAGAWPQHRDAMIQSWRTKNFKPNQKLIPIIKKAARRS